MFFRNIFNEIQLATVELDNVQREIADFGDNDDEFEREMNQIVKVNGLLAQRQAFIRQKNRFQWLKDGYHQNSAFFHHLHSSSKVRASINIVQVGE